VNRAAPRVDAASGSVSPNAAERSPWLGIGLGTLCALIWGGQAVISRQSVSDGLTTADVSVLRFVTAALVLLPVALRRCKPFPVGRLGWWRAIALTALAGAPYSLVLVGGVAFAPALHSAVITPGLIPLVAMGLACLVHGERPTPARLAGLALIVIGVALFSWDALTGMPAREGAWRGDLLFVLAAFMWALFGLLSKRWRADPVEVTVAICLLSVLTVPVWAGFLPMRLAQASAGAITLQALYQGLLVGVVALALYTRAVALLGAARAALFLPLVPAVTALTGAIMLGELPSGSEVLGMAVVMGGMALGLRASSPS
jgi:drug/metabolite transporter (DMT)-like permease